MNDNADEPTNLRPGTQLIRGGLTRSAFGETCEGIFMTSGFVYPSAEDAEGAFAGERERYIYSRFTNPTCYLSYTYISG